MPNETPESNARRTRSWRHALGPGFLFAGAAIGVSHLVQSTRAGAAYGLALIPIVIIANLLKYPAFAFGPHYAAATGTSLLEGYRRQGRWALVLYALLTFGSMFTVQAAVTVVTAGLAKVTFGLELGVVPISAGLLGVGILLVGFGGYRVLDRLMKVTVALLTLATVAATILAVGRLDFAAQRLWPAAEAWTPALWFFVAALVGWMPAAIDVSVWHSLWTLARREDSGHRPTVRDARLDFNIGYLGTAVLAVCFVILGASVVHGSGEAMPDGAGAFAARVIGLYTETLGAWAGPIISFAALAVMVSTTLTVLDGFPRALAALYARATQGAEDPNAGEAKTPRAYWVALVVLAVGSVAVLAFAISGLKALVDIATSISFLTGPALAWLNHRAVFGPDLRPEDRPGRGLWLLSWTGILFLGALAILWMVVRFGG